MSAQKVSFTVRRPTPVSRASSGAESDSSFKVPALPHHKRAGLNDSLPGSPLSHSLAASPHPEPDSDSSDDDAEGRDELVDAFDRLNGAQRCVPLFPDDVQPFQLTSDPLRTIPSRKRGPTGPLVIPALKNKDWRELARKRRTAGQYIPPSAAAQTGADGSVGGLGTRDSINSGPVLQGLQIRGKQTNDQEMKEEEEEGVKMEVVEEELTEDELALRAILSGNAQSGDGPLIDIIPTPATEDDAYKQDVDELPEPATLNDYDRIPVSQFGAAMLRGMGWKEGQAASRKPGKGIVEPYLPSARPALLGIGAKEQEVYDDGSKKNLKPKRQDRKYVPLVKVAREGSEKRERSVSPRRATDSARSSRRSSPDRRNEKDRSSRRDDDRDRDRRHREDADSSRRSSHRDRERDRDGRRERSRERESSRKSRNY